MLCRLASLRSYLKSGKTLKNMKKITLFIMDVGVLYSVPEVFQVFLVRVLASQP